MLKLAMAVVPPTDLNLKAASQIGVRHLVHYDMSNDPAKFDGLQVGMERAARAGLNVPVIEAGPSIDRIVLGRDGAEQQIAHWITMLRHLAVLGVEVVCYNFMPQVLSDAMVVRTSEASVTRGGSITTSFRTADLPPDAFQASMGPPVEAMRDNLARFLKAVLPVANDLNLRLAMHPDDPPMSPMWGHNRIMSSAESFDWLMNLDSSRANALTLCAGCLGEMEENPSVFARKYADRIAFVHLRNIRGTRDDFIETWPDDGDLDLPDLLKTMMDLKVDAYMRPDHAPRLATEEEGTIGYGPRGHIFTLGYLRGILDTYKRNSQ